MNKVYGGLVALVLGTSLSVGVNTVKAESQINTDELKVISVVSNSNILELTSELTDLNNKYLKVIQEQKEHKVKTEKVKKDNKLNKSKERAEDKIKEIKVKAEKKAKEERKKKENKKLDKLLADLEDKGYGDNIKGNEKDRESLTENSTLASIDGADESTAGNTGKVNTNNTEFKTQTVDVNSNEDSGSIYANFDEVYDSTNKKLTAEGLDESGQKVRDVALRVAQGKRYVFGANSSTEVDCSSFAQQVLREFGKEIPRVTWDQMAAGTRVTDPKPGDLVFFNNGSHVGVYIGNGRMVDALNPRMGVGERAISWLSNSTITGYYRF